jgi:hypothetical protein
MAISLKSNPTGNSGSIQVNGTDVVTFDSTGNITATSLAVTSTAVVTNLNADMLDGQQASYYTGLIDAKAPIASPTFTGTVGGITAAMVGLGNVNNTADTAKPVSTAQQTALDLKANLAGLATQVFSVANGASGNNAVNFGQFPSSLATNGYQKLPNGFIMQWGIQNSVANGATFSPSFPIAFPTACVFAVNIPTIVNGIAQMAPVVTAVSTTSFTGYNTTGITNNFRWFAIGY